MSRSRKFALQLSRRIRGAKIKEVKPHCYVVSGKLDIGLHLVPIEVHVWWFFKKVKRTPPAVRCLAEWMRRGDEWHNDEYMCWVLEDYWRDIMSWKGKSADRIIAEGCDWLLRDVGVLANRHYYAHIHNLTRWPEEWEYWEHFEAGAVQYQQEKRRKKGLGP